MKTIPFHALLACASAALWAGCATTPPSVPVTAPLSQPRGVTVDAAGNVYAGDIGNSLVVKIPAASPGAPGVVFAGTDGKSGAADGPGTRASFFGPIGLAADAQGNIFVADSDNHQIRKISPTGVVTTIAGKSGAPAYADGPGPDARFNDPTSVAVDRLGNVYVADNLNHVVRKISPSGMVTTLAGAAGQPGETDGKGSGARFNGPRGIAVDSAGNVYVAAQFTSTIRRISPDGAVTTLAGQSGKTGSEDGLHATFNVPRGVAVDSRGNVYVADTDNHTIRKITSVGVVTTLAGQAGQKGAVDGWGAAARFNGPRGLAVDKDGNIFVADTDNGLIRKVTPGGAVTTFARPPAK